MFKPTFTITPQIANALIRIEILREKIINLPITPKVLMSLKESARLSSTHYSTMIEGNRLTKEEVQEVVKQKQILRGRERDQKEVLGYYKALDELERLTRLKKPLTEQHIQLIHALVMSGDKKKVIPTPYRTEQNVIRESSTGAIVYLPPEAKDVPELMKDLVAWITKNSDNLPFPLVAGIAHYQYATIHPYIDGNGRTARLLTTLILHLSGYDLKGIYSLDEYYAKNLSGYYDALSIGSSHNYYMGRSEADITPWVTYFISGMLQSFENITGHALKASESGAKDSSSILKTFDARQRMVLTLFQKYQTITSEHVEKLLGIHPRSARGLCQRWAEEGFLIIVDPSKKARKYGLAPEYEKILKA